MFRRTRSVVEQSKPSVLWPAAFEPLAALGWSPWAFKSVTLNTQKINSVILTIVYVDVGNHQCCGIGNTEGMCRRIDDLHVLECSRYFDPGHIDELIDLEATKLTPTSSWGEVL